MTERQIQEKANGLSHGLKELREDQLKGIRLSEKRGKL
jgi:hypothetical protein